MNRRNEYRTRIRDQGRVFLEMDLAGKTFNALNTLSTELGGVRRGEIIDAWLNYIFNLIVQDAMKKISEEYTSLFNTERLYDFVVDAGENPWDWERYMPRRAIGLHLEFSLDSHQPFYSLEVIHVSPESKSAFFFIDASTSLDDIANALLELGFDSDDDDDDHVLLAQRLAQRHMAGIGNCICLVDGEWTRSSEGTFEFDEAVRGYVQRYFFPVETSDEE